MEKFMEEYFSYRTMLELSLRRGKNWDNFVTFWRLRAMADENIKEKLPTFKKLVKKIKNDPNSWDRLIGIFKGQFLAIYYPQEFKEIYDKQLEMIQPGGDICDSVEHEAHKKTIRILEEYAFNEINQFESPF